MKRLFLSILLCVFVWGMKAQEMDAVFVAMPDQYVPQLENAWRKDLIDLYNSGKEAKLKNTMNGFSTLKKLTDDYLLLQVTERSTVEMKLLPLVNDTYVVCMITTVYGPVPDSQVEFFTTDWKLLDSADLYTPVPVEWFIKDDADKNRTAFIEATARLDMDLRKYSLSPDDQTLTVEYTTPKYLTKTERDFKLPVVIIITAVLILLLSNTSIGIGICAKAGMMCHKTALWGRIGAVLAIIGAGISLFVHKSQMPQAN